MDLIKEIWFFNTYLNSIHLTDTQVKHSNADLNFNIIKFNDFNKIYKLSLYTLLLAYVNIYINRYEDTMSITEAQLQQFIETVFNRYDSDKRGTLDAAELANFFNDVYAQMGQPIRLNQAQAM